MIEHEADWYPLAMQRGEAIEALNRRIAVIEYERDAAVAAQAVECERRALAAAQSERDAVVTWLRTRPSLEPNATILASAARLVELGKHHRVAGGEGGRDG